MTKPFVLYEMKESKNSRPSKRMRASMQVQRTQCEWLEAPRQSSPESALAMAVLQRAVMDLITPGVSEKDRNNAFGWIVGAWGEEHEKDYPLSFSRIVESYTELEVGEFREKILAFSEQAKNEEVLADGFRFQRGS